MKLRVTIICLMLIFLCGCAGVETKNKIEEKEEIEEGYHRISRYEMEEIFDVAYMSGADLYGGYNANASVFISIIPEYEKAYDKKIVELPGEQEIISLTENNNELIALTKTDDNYSAYLISQNGMATRMGDIELDKMGDWPIFKGISCSKDGYYFIWVRMTVLCTDVYENGEENVYTPVDRIYVKDSNMKSVLYEDFPDSYGNMMYSFMMDVDNNPIVLAKDEDGIYLKKISKDSHNKTEKKYIEKISLTNSMIDKLRVIDEDTLCFIDKDKIYEYSLKEDIKRVIASTSEAGIDETSIVDWYIENDVIYVISNSIIDEKTEIVKIEKGASEKKTIAIGVFNLSSNNRRVISTFNRENNEIQVVPIEYVENYDYDLGYDRLKLDVIQGKAPDLFFVEGIDYEILAEKGVFANINDFLDSDDELGREDINNSILKCYEENGKLYQIGPSFVIYSMWGPQSIWQDAQNISFKELRKKLSDNKGSINSIYGLSSSDESAIRVLTSMELDNYINWEEYTCDFENNSFYELLDVVAEYKGVDIGEGLYDSIQNNKILLSCGIITSVEDYCIQRELYGEKITFIGYPSGEVSSSAINILSPVAINSSSQYKDEAWKFVKYFLLHGREYETTGFATYKPIFEEELLKSMKEKYTETENGFEPIAKAYYHELGGVKLTVNKVTPEDVETVRSLIESADKKYEYVKEVQKIIEEEANIYINKAKTKEETAKVIQSRIKLYLEEQKK